LERQSHGIIEILISRSEQRPMADLYGFNLQEPIPSFPLPLKQSVVEQPNYILGFFLLRKMVMQRTPIAFFTLLVGN
jgi:Protein of unknown function (DUF4058)